LEEKGEDEIRLVGKMLFAARFYDPKVRRLVIFSGLIILALISTIALILIFHGSDTGNYPGYLKGHLEEMSQMHNRIGYYYLQL
jgi:hypothetical protein